MIGEVAIMPQKLLAICCLLAMGQYPLDRRPPQVDQRNSTTAPRPSLSQ